jgi:hypothetical protein
MAKIGWNIFYKKLTGKGLDKKKKDVKISTNH